MKTQSAEPLVGQMGISGSTKAKKIYLPRTSKAKNKLVFHLSCERNNFNPLVIPISLISYAKGGNTLRSHVLAITHAPRYTCWRCQSLRMHTSQCPWNIQMVCIAGLRWHHFCQGKSLTGWWGDRFKLHRILLLIIHQPPFTGRWLRRRIDGAFLDRHALEFAHPTWIEPATFQCFNAWSSATTLRQPHRCPIDRAHADC